MEGWWMGGKWVRKEEENGMKKGGKIWGKWERLGVVC